MVWFLCTSCTCMYLFELFYHVISQLKFFFCENSLLCFLSKKKRQHFCFRRSGLLISTKFSRKVRLNYNGIHPHTHALSLEPIVIRTIKFILKRFTPPEIELKKKKMGYGTCDICICDSVCGKKQWKKIEIFKLKTELLLVAVMLVFGFDSFFEKQKKTTENTHTKWLAKRKMCKR